MQDKFELMMNTHLNGEWKTFQESCVDIKSEIDKLTPEQVKERLEEFKKKLNKV